MTTSIFRVARCAWIGWKKPKRPRTTLKCPHGVQFYDVVIDGKRHKRAAWSYEKPRPAMAQVGGRFGFWEDVEVA